MNKKGQISLEFMLLVLISLIYIHSVILPTMQVSAAAAEDVTRLTKVRLAAQTIADSIDAVAVSGTEAKKTVHFTVPKDTWIVCDNVGKKIEYYIKLNKDLTAPSSVHCDPISLECNSAAAFSSSADLLACFPVVQASALVEMVVKKNAAGKIDFETIPS